MSETKAGDRYVVGLMFNPTEDAVLLIRKTHPAWQLGKLNGVGGRIEADEVPIQAMRREFLEETGIDHEKWRLFCLLGDARKWQVYFFAALGRIAKAKPLTDEQPEIIPTATLPDDVIPNLRWLIPMALSMKYESVCGFDIQEIVDSIAVSALEAT